MAEQDIFHWHKDARLFAGTEQIMPDPAPARTGLRAISTASAAHALSSLAEVLGTGTPFCLHRSPWDEAMGTDEGTFLTLTGGTSGRPKFIRRSQASWIRSFEVNADLFGLAPPDSVAVLGNLSHSLALYGVLEALHVGLDAHVLGGSGPSRQRVSILTNAIRIIFATPAQLRLLAGSRSGHVMSSVRLVLCGGGHLDASSLRRMHDVFPNAELRVFYGAAETSFITLTDADTPAGSVGKAYPNVEIALRQTAETVDGAQGEIWVRSPYLFEGYASGEGPDTHWHDGFVTIGELGRRDGQGNIWITGRKSRVIRIADQNISPEEVEAVIGSCEGGALCAVLARPDPLRGHHLVAVVEGPPDDRRAHRIKQACRRLLGPLHTPRQVMFLKNLPLLPSGKIDLHRLEAAL